MTAARLKASILQLAVTGKLVPQDPADEPAGELLKRILAAKASKGVPRSRAAKSAARPEDSGFSGDAPFEIPENWAWARLNDLFRFIDYRGKTPKKIASGIRLITAKNVRPGFVNKFPEEFISEEEFATRQSRGLAKRGDILFTTEAPMGYAAIVEEDVFSTGQRLITFQQYGRKELLCNRFFMFSILSPYFQQQLVNQNTGVTVSGIKGERLKQFAMPLPPLAEQKRIVARIEELMPLVDEYGKLEEKRLQLDADLPGALEKAILQDAIQGKLVPQDPAEGTAAELLREIQAAKNAKGAKGKSHAKSAKSAKASSVVSVDVVPPDDQPFEIPSSWAWCKLGDVSEVIRGSGIKRSETTSSGIPCIRYGEIYTTYGFSFREAKSFTSKTVADKCAIARCGDVLCTLTGECKEEIAKTTTYLGEVNLAVGGDLAKISKHPFEPLLLVYFMFSPFMLAQKADKSNGDIIVHIGKEAIENLLIPLPPLAEQKRIVAKVEQLLAAVRKLKTEADR